jgi:hypothetical protein
MNARVEAGSLTISLTAQIVEPTVKVSVKTAYTNVLRSTWTCLNSAPLSVNGHSLSAINPELVLNGGMATLEMA